MRKTDDKACVNIEPALRRELLAVPQFSRGAKVTDSCTRRWLLERKISYVKLGRLVRIPADELDRLIEEGLRPRREVTTR